MSMSYALQKGLGILLLLLSACTAAATPTGSPEIAPATITISAAELTAAVRFRPTLPPTFTPTSTPSHTPTPTATFTPTITLTPSPVPEAMLCREFAVVLDQPDEAVYQLEPVALQLFVRYPEVTIRFVVTNAESGEEVLRVVKNGGRLHLAALMPFEFPQEGRYLWRATLFDTERSDLCPLVGSFIIDKTTPPTATAEITAEVTPEVTASAD